jgi:hypothetical protein
MQRREVLKLLAGTAALPLLSADALAFFQAVHEQIPVPAALKTLNPHQDATVTAIAEWIIPETETPGAKAVRVNEFIDLILTDWMDEEERTKFLSGIADVDARCHEAFGKDFVDGSAAEQKQMLTVLDEELTEFRQVEAEAPSRRHKIRPDSDKPFFDGMKQLTLAGYFTSEAGAKQALHFQIIPSQHAACVPEEEEVAK